jgi:hypothetical protein
MIFLSSLPPRDIPEANQVTFENRASEAPDVQHLPAWLRFCNAHRRMSQRALTISALPLCLAFALGCESTRPIPPSPPPAPVETAEPATPPPPPPKCEALDEKCEAKDDTRASIARSDLVIKPPAGWIYAQLSGATIAELGDATLAVAGYEADAKDVKKDSASRDAAFSDLLKQIGIDNPTKKKVSWKKPAAPKPVGDLKLDLWEISDWVRGTKKGPLVVVAGSTSEGKGILIIGFVPGDDKSGADDAILKAIDSLGTAK